VPQNSQHILRIESANWGCFPRQYLLSTCLWASLCKIQTS